MGKKFSLRLWGWIVTHRKKDTDREFTINKTKCHVVDGRIQEVGNISGVPDSIYQKAVKRYEEWAYKPLAER